MGDTKYLLAHDFGTSGDKATLFTTEGKFVATKTAGYPSITLSNGGVEQDPLRLLCRLESSFSSRFAASRMSC